MEEGKVVICPTGQAGTLVQNVSGLAWVLLRNGYIWNGSVNLLRQPQDAAELEACIIDIEHLTK